VSQNNGRGKPYLTRKVGRYTSLSDSEMWTCEPKQWAWQALPDTEGSQSGD